MPELCDPSPGNPQLRRTVRIRARNDRIGRHPVVFMGHTLFAGQQREDRRCSICEQSEAYIPIIKKSRRTQAIYTNSLPFWEMHHFALEGEVVALLCTAEDALPLGADHLDAQIKQLEGVLRHYYWRGEIPQQMRLAREILKLNMHGEISDAGVLDGQYRTPAGHRGHWPDTDQTLEPVPLFQ